MINLGEIPIVKIRSLALNRNPYLRKDEEYFNKRTEKLIYTKFRAALYHKYKNLCAVCGESVYNGEPVELHHIIPRKTGGKYDLKNIQPVHRVCHQQLHHK